MKIIKDKNYLCPLEVTKCENITKHLEKKHKDMLGWRFNFTSNTLIIEVPDVET